MGQHIFLDGDIIEAGKYLPLAKRKLKQIRNQLSYSHLDTNVTNLKIEDADVQLKINGDEEFIFIKAGRKENVFAAYVGDDTTDYSHKKYYKLLPSDKSEINFTLKEITEEQAKKMLDVNELIDDGKYYSIYTGTVYDDIYQYDFQYTNNGLNVPINTNSGIPAKKYNAKEIRYILTNVGEVNYVSTVNDAYYYIKPFSPSFAEGFFSFPELFYGFIKYVDDGVLFSSLTWTYADPTSGVLYSAPYFDESYACDPGGNVSGNVNCLYFTDAIPKTNYIYHHKFDGTVTKYNLEEFSDIPTPKAVCGVKPFSKNNTSNEVYGLTYAFNDDHSINVSKVDLKNKSVSILDKHTRYNGNPAYAYSDFFRALNYGFADENDYGFNKIKNTMKLPLTVLDNSNMNYLEVNKNISSANNDITNIQFKIYCNNKLVEETPFTSTIQYIQGNHLLGRLIISPYVLHPLYFFNDDSFDAVFYLKETVLNTEKLDTEYKLDYISEIDGSCYYYLIKYIKIDFKVENYVWVNGVIHKLYYEGKATTFYPYIETYDRDCSTTIDDIAGTPATIYPAEYTNSGYDFNCNTISQENYALTRPYFDSVNDKLFFGIDIFKTSFKNRLTYDTNTKELYPNRESPPYPETDANPLYDRKWFFFDKDGNSKTIEPPQKDDGSGNLNNWERINGVAVL